MKEKIKEIIIKFFKNGRGVIFLLFALQLILTLFITPSTYDDEWFISQVTDEINPETNEIIKHTIPDFIEYRYHNWSSRILIEFVLCTILKTSKYLWVIIQSLMVTLTCYSISKLFVKEEKAKNNFMLMLMILIYPYNIMHQTGWASTSINYMWPLATGLFALIPIRKMWDGEKIKLFEYPLYTLSLIFSANQEQACAILLGFYLAFSVILIVRKDKNLKPYMIFQTFIAIISIVFILTCPGNAIRQEEELYRFTDYQMLSFIDKFVLGFTSTFGRIIAFQNPVYILMTALIAVYICLNYKEKLYRVVALLPIVTILVLGPFLPLLHTIFPYLNVFKELLIREDVILTVTNCNNIYYAFPMIFAFINFICIGMSILLIFKNLKNNVAILIYLAGLASRLILAFSPTVFVSKTRTMIFFDFAMIIISYLVWEKLNKKRIVDNKKNPEESEVSEKTLKIINTIIKFSAIIQYANVLIYIYSRQKLF